MVIEGNASMRKQVRLIWLSIAFASLAIGCGDEAGSGGDGGGGEPVLQSIAVEPENATLIIDGDVAATEQYRAVGTYSDGATRDISDEVTFFVDDVELGRFDGATFTSDVRKGGQTTVRATHDSVSGLAVLTLVIRQRHGDPQATDLPTDPAAPFEGPADPDRAPSLVYPADGVLLPPNLEALEVHFMPGLENTLFELSFASEYTDVKVFTRCVMPLNGGCIYTPDEDVWRWIAESNRGSNPLTVSVRGTDDAGTAVGSSESLSVSFSQDNIDGGIYYWTTSSTADSATAIMRYDFGADTRVPPERFIGTEMTNSNCVGCHALSPNGESMVVASDASFGALVLLLDVSTKTAKVPFGSSPRSAFSSWNPEGSQYVGVFANDAVDGFLSWNLNLFDGETGASVGTIDVGGTKATPASHPDWSPTGDAIAYTRVGQTREERISLARDIYENSLRVVTRDGNGQWSAPVELTAAVTGESTHYPTFSPSGELLAYNRSVCADGANGVDCDAYDDPGAALWIMEPTAGAEPISMARADAPGTTDTAAVVQNSYPKWSPFTFRRSGEMGSRLHWITFSSNRNYGLRTPPAGNTLIWMAAIDPDAALRGEDPSFTAFALPFQDLATDNHTAQWTQEIISIE